MMNKIGMWLMLCALAGALLLLGGRSLAQQEQNTNAGGNTNSAGNANSAGNMNAGGNQNTGRAGGQQNGNTSGGAMAGLSSADRKFATTAAMGGMAEVEMARVAVQRATSEAVRQYAQRMIDDHTRANQELMQVLSGKGMAAPAGLDAKHRAMLDKLNRRTGADFDREYIRTAGVKAHQDMAKLFQNEINKGQDADLKSFATRTLPAVQEHLTMAQGMAGSMGGGNRGGNANAGGGNANMGGNMNTSGNMNMSGGNMNSGETGGNMNAGGNTNSNRRGGSNRNGNANSGGNSNANANTSRNTNNSNR